MIQKICLTFLLLGCFFSGYAQITKPEIESMLNEVGGSMETLQKVWVWNLKVMNEEGGWYRTRFTYNATFSDETGHNQFSLLDSGIKISSQQGGKTIEVVYYPYNVMTNFIVSKDNIQFQLKE